MSSTCDLSGHDEVTTYEDPTGFQWRCARCGAEGWVEAEAEDGA